MLACRRYAIDAIASIALRTGPTPEKWWGVGIVTGDSLVTGVLGASIPFAKSSIAFEALWAGSADGSIISVSTFDFGETRRRIIGAFGPLDAAGLAFLQSLS